MRTRLQLLKAELDLTCRVPEARELEAALRRRWRRDRWPGWPRTCWCCHGPGGRFRITGEHSCRICSAAPARATARAQDGGAVEWPPRRWRSGRSHAGRQRSTTAGQRDPLRRRRRLIRVGATVSVRCDVGWRTRTGFGDALLPRAFEAFVRGETDVRRTLGGLGLAIVQAVAGRTAGGPRGERAGRARVT